MGANTKSNKTWSIPSRIFNLSAYWKLQLSHIFVTYSLLSLHKYLLRKECVNHFSICWIYSRIQRIRCSPWSPKRSNAREKTISMMLRTGKPKLQLEHMEEPLCATYLQVSNNVLVDMTLKLKLEEMWIKKKITSRNWVGTIK